jgi:FixJ family two-component response regulator
VSDDCTIYIVDDDACVRRALTRLLAASGYGVVTCESAEALLALPSLARPSCLLVDIRMPGSTGLELQHALGDSANPPIVILSGHADATMAERALACGAIAVLLKPRGRVVVTERFGKRPRPRSPNDRKRPGAGTSRCSATFPP